jgi:tetratricopeptide (TPR) repeat protein
MGSVYSLNTFRADRLLEDGRFHVSKGDLDQAIEAFQQSIEVKESAEALTFLGWVLSLKGQYEEAMELCRRAIEIDPDFGNPYNDLGSYLMKEDRFEEAILWLEKAKTARRYDARHFPHMNLGRIYSSLGRVDEAIVEFSQALQFVPDHQEIKNVLEQLKNIKKLEINA